MDPRELVSFEQLKNEGALVSLDILKAKLQVRSVVFIVSWV